MSILAMNQLSPWCPIYDASTRQLPVRSLAEITSCPGCPLMLMDNVRQYAESEIKAILF